ncbi:MULTISPECIES: lysoplasmalogenase [Paenibacillus]|uniref:Lysoplasmalogenase n=1 Tax=Paenibacillus albilobatus TaxID=2716884 RepID=A0A920CAN9_9BACL|nr:MULTISPECIES: lysoplasmalogenase [Paenibacillus]GIO30264.1 lysoplasmalogenase [Paenibacillus albilobatus]
MVKKLLPYLILTMGLLHIFLLHHLLFKLIPMALILVYAYLQCSSANKRHAFLTLAGLFFCMLGDGLLRFFVVGLSAFLIGHLFYLSAFLMRWRFSPLRLCAALPLAGFAAFMGWKLHGGLTAGGHDNLIVPVFLYVAVITLMGFFAVMTGNWRCAAGALLFIASDSILSWNMFVSDIAYSGVLVMGTYYTAQFLIAGSIRHRLRASGGIQNGSDAPVRFLT